MARSQLLDILRVAAIGLVLMAHIGQYLGADAGDFFGVKNFYYVSLGGVGVSIFLVLSGLLAGLTNGRKKTGYVSYLYKKAKRIYPLYWLSLPITILGYGLTEGLLTGERINWFPNGIITDLIGSITGFYAWAGLWGGPYNPPSWFIGLIISLYAIFPILMWLINRQALLTLCVLFIISVTSRYYIGQDGLPFSDPSLYDNIKNWFYRQYGFMPGRPGDWFPLCRVFEFGLGIYLAKQVPSRFWGMVNLPFSKVVYFLSDIAFAVFLVHLPYLFLIDYLVDWGLPTTAAVGIFVVALLPCGWALTRVEQVLTRR
jgi:peptidoglycan/LPS O-acetylase OafA/YrhL